MSGTRYRRNGMYAADMAVYARMMAEDNHLQMEQMRAYLIEALKTEVTPRQREVLYLYYAEGLNSRQIGEALHRDRSTISRTIRRGEARLRRCLRFGGAELLKAKVDTE